jgi:hypothetical protein
MPSIRALPEAVRQLLGQSSLTATSAYLGIDQQAALEIARQFKQ